MIKKYNQFLNEGILDKLTGPSKEEILSNLDNMTPNKALVKSIELDNQPGIYNALKRGAWKEIYDNYVKAIEIFENNIEKIIEYKDAKFPNSVFWLNNNKILFEQQTLAHRTVLLIDYDLIKPLILDLNINWNESCELLGNLIIKYLGFTFDQLIPVESESHSTWICINSKLNKTNESLL